MTLEEENAQLRAANATLQAGVARLQGVVTTLEAQLAELRPSRRLSSNPTNPPRPPSARPTEVRTHAYDTCPTCAYLLTGASLARREALDHPAPGHRH